LVQELAGLKAREVAVKATRAVKATKPPATTTGAVPSRLKTLLGGIAGGAVGSAVGHPVLGYYAGKEAARAASKK